jgi:acetolactate synthase-1/2/3 large subunit
MDTGNGAMGYGVCAALGAKAGAPDRPVVSVSGDGGFVMVNMVLATAVEYDLPVKWIIMNDQGFVAIAGLQEAYFEGEYKTHFERSDSDPYDIDYVQMADSFEVPAQRAKTPEELRTAIDDALSVDSPYLIDARVSRAGPGVDNGAQWVQSGRGTGGGEAEGESAEANNVTTDD